MATSHALDDFDDSTELLAIENWLKNLGMIFREDFYVRTIQSQKKQRISSKKMLKESKMSFLKSSENVQNGHFPPIFQNFQSEIDNLTQRVNEADTLILRFNDLLSQQPSIPTFISELKGKFKAQMAKQQQKQIKIISDLEKEIEHLRQNEDKANEKSQKVEDSMKTLEKNLKEEMDFIISQHDQEWQKVLAEKSKEEQAQIEIFEKEIKKHKEGREFAEVSMKSLEEAYEKLRGQNQENLDAQTSLIQTLRDEIERLSYLSKQPHSPASERSDDESIVQAYEQLLQDHMRRVGLLESQLAEKNKHLEGLEDEWGKEKLQMHTHIKELEDSLTTQKKKCSVLNEMVDSLPSQGEWSAMKEKLKLYEAMELTHTQSSASPEQEKYISELKEEIYTLKSIMGGNAHTLEQKDQKILDLEEKIKYLEENEAAIQLQLHSTNLHTHDKIGGDTMQPHNLQDILTSQKERLKQELREVESSRDEWKSLAEMEHAQTQRLQNDNVSLIEKVRYLETLAVHTEMYPQSTEMGGSHMGSSGVLGMQSGSPSSSNYTSSIPGHVVHGVYEHGAQLVRRPNREVLSSMIQSSYTPSSYTQNTSSYINPMSNNVNFSSSNSLTHQNIAPSTHTATVRTHYDDVYEHQLGEQLGSFNENILNIYTNTDRNNSLLPNRQKLRHSIQKWLRDISVAFKMSFGRMNKYNEYYTPLPINNHPKSNTQNKYSHDNQNLYNERPTIENFRSREKLKKLNTLNFAERNVIVWGSLCVSSRPMRILVFTYTLLLHLFLLFFILNSFL